MALSDGIHVAGTLARAGMLRPSRPDRAMRAIMGLHRFGPTMAAGIMGGAARFPHVAAVVDDDGSITFGELERRTNALARGLAGHGLTEGRTVAMMCRNDRGFIEVAAACSKLGAHVVLLNTGFAGPQVAEVLEREGADGLVYDREFATTVQEARGDRACFVADADDTEDTSLARLIATRVDTPLPPPAVAGRAIILTSGTTGTPKGANRPAPSSMGPMAALLAAIPLRARGTTVIAAPLFHAWGFAHVLLATALSSTIVLRRRFDALDTVRAVAETRADALVVVPVMLQRMLEAHAEERLSLDTSSLRVIAVSGSALPGPLANRVMDAFGDALYNLYGSTEVAWATVAGPADLRAAPGTAGRPPRGTVVKVLDERGDPLPAGTSGRICVGSEMLFEGYTGGGDKDRRGGLMATGDVGHFDGAGRLFVDGRDDDMIVSGGENVFPGEVEDLLAGVAGIREVAVVGVADDEFGQRLRAVVSLHPGAELSEGELQDHVRNHLARYKVPREVVFVEQLPRNETGKILKRELR
ncbi:MAG TPA: AMP-binding protein [Solirubrobacteraceae bacterium]